MLKKKIKETEDKFKEKLEVCRDRYDEEQGETIRHINDILNRDYRRARFAEDGSLCNGFEIITEPMAKQDMANLPIEELCEYLKERGYYSHKYGSSVDREDDQAGLHYHINRSRFGKTTKQKETTIAKLIYFFGRYFSEIIRLSRRGCENHYAERPII